MCRTESGTWLSRSILYYTIAYYSILVYPVGGQIYSATDCHLVQLCCLHHRESPSCEALGRVPGGKSQNSSYFA